MPFFLRLSAENVQHGVGYIHGVHSTGGARRRGDGEKSHAGAHVAYGAVRAKSSASSTLSICGSRTRAGFSKFLTRFIHICLPFSSTGPRPSSFAQT